MKSIITVLILSLVLSFSLGGCTKAPEPVEPPPVEVKAPAQPATPPPAPAAPAEIAEPVKIEIEKEAEPIEVKRSKTGGKEGKATKKLKLGGDDN